MAARFLRNPSPSRIIERLASANAEKSLRFFYAVVIAEELESHLAVALFQDNSKKMEMMTA